MSCRYEIRVRAVLELRLLPLERRMAADEAGLDPAVKTLAGQWSEKSEAIATAGVALSASAKAEDSTHDFAPSATRAVALSVCCRPRVCVCLAELLVAPSRVWHALDYHVIDYRAVPRSARRGA
jgi:hypothetical protein|eukprot:COSAG01_NODE_366_length_18064_cov_35.830615_2_plen_124_part_00